MAPSMSAVASPAMARVVSGVKPTGTLNLGGYLGAFRSWAAEQHRSEAFYFVADLHALTVPIDPARLRSSSMEVARTLLAVGLDPEVCSLYVQSHVAEHVRLAWLLECTATLGELQRMTQFKDKGGGQASVRAGLLTYPALMAADILLYGAQEVPVGDDQRQHLELTRDVAIRFNHHYGEVFTVPTATVPSVAARVMDLQQPTRKMSKSSDSPQGTIDLLDAPEVIRRKVTRAVTDAETDVRYDPERKPGISNLLELLGAATDAKPEELALGYGRYGDLKADVADALVELLAPIRAREAELRNDSGFVQAVLRRGAEQAAAVAGPTYRRAAAAIGLPVP